MHFAGALFLKSVHPWFNHIRGGCQRYVPHPPTYTQHKCTHTQIHFLCPALSLASYLTQQKAPVDLLTKGFGNLEAHPLSHTILAPWLRSNRGRGTDKNSGIRWLRRVDWRRARRSGTDYIAQAWAGRPECTCHIDLGESWPCRWPRAQLHLSSKQPFPSCASWPVPKSW